MIIDEVKSYIQKELIDDDTMSVLLIGSWANNNFSDPYDIDIMIIKKAQLTEMLKAIINPNNTIILNHSY